MPLWCDSGRCSVFVLDPSSTSCGSVTSKVLNHPHLVHLPNYCLRCPLSSLAREGAPRLSCFLLRTISDWCCSRKSVCVRRVGKMLQDGVPGLYRKPSLRPERGERRAREVGWFCGGKVLLRGAPFRFALGLVLVASKEHMGMRGYICLAPHINRAPPGQQVTPESRSGWWRGCTLAWDL